MTTKRRIVVDNATLSGVERITGASRTANLSNTNNDILCLEKLITSILFSDQLIGLDDYKDSYRSSRLKNFDFIPFKKIEQTSYSKMADGAAKFAKGMLFSFDGAKPAGDVVSFFEALRINPQMRWDIFVSSEYLTLSLLVNDPKSIQYENAVDAAFRNENTDQLQVSLQTEELAAFAVKNHPDITSVKDFVHAMSSSNPNYSGIGHKDMLRRMVFGYGWAAERSYFYNTFAAENEADAFLSPLRDAFCESCCRIQSRSQIDSLLEKLKNTSQETLTAIIETSGEAKFMMRLPFFTSYFISMTDNPMQSIELALNYRNRSEFQDCRDIFSNMSHLSKQDRYREVNGILRYLQQSCDDLMKKYSVSTGNGVTFSLSLGLTGINFAVSTKLNDLLRAYRFRAFSKIFRNIAVDMLNLERLGSLYEKLCSSVQEDKDAKHSKVSTTPKFMENRESSHGRPASL